MKLRTKLILLATVTAAPFVTAQTMSRIMYGESMQATFNHQYPIVQMQTCRVTVADANQFNVALGAKCATRMPDIRGVCIRVVSGQIVKGECDAGLSPTTGWPLNRDDERCFEVISTLWADAGFADGGVYLPCIMSATDASYSLAIEEYR